jgi:hypothetical protein
MSLLLVSRCSAGSWTSQTSCSTCREAVRAVSVHVVAASIMHFHIEILPIFEFLMVRYPSGRTVPASIFFYRTDASTVALIIFCSSSRKKKIFYFRNEGKLYCLVLFLFILHPFPQCLLRLSH